MHYRLHHGSDTACDYVVLHSHYTNHPSLVQSLLDDLTRPDIPSAVLIHVKVNNDVHLCYVYPWVQPSLCAVS